MQTRRARHSVRVRPLDPEDIRPVCGYLPGHIRAQILSSKAWTALEDGPVAICGLSEQWEGFIRAWFVAKKNLSLKTWFAITERIREGIVLNPCRRLEVVVDPRSEKAVKWAERLGFTRESLARNYLPDGGDAYIYVILGESNEKDCP